MSQFKEHMNHCFEMLGLSISHVIPKSILRGVLRGASESCPQEMAQQVARKFGISRSLKDLNPDFDLSGDLEFEHLSGLFSSTTFDHSIITITLRQAAYLYHLIRKENPKEVLEIGRFKGGGTLLMAAALRNVGRLWSVDIGEKESRMFGEGQDSLFDKELKKCLHELHLKAEILVGDSRTLDIPVDKWDIVFLDGDHSYEGVLNDYERFGKKLRIGGSLLFDDAYDDPYFINHSDTVGRLINEILDDGKFELTRKVDRMAHLTRIKE